MVCVQSRRLVPDSSVLKMQSSVSVTASGPVLSLLLYENTKAPSYQMGFLLGAVVHQVTDTISDSQMRGEKTETIINISSILPISMSSHIVDGAGKVNKEKLSAIVRAEKIQQKTTGSQSHDIVGWYSFYRRSSYALSLRERMIHLQLSKMAKEFSQDSSPELFVLCLLLHNLTSKATHVFKHSFMRYIADKNTFDLISLQIHNLGMTQLSQYQNLACAPSRLGLLRQIFSPDMQGKDHMLNVESELQVMLKQQVQKLSRTESIRINLESEVEKLQEELENMKRKAQMTGTSAAEDRTNGSDQHPTLEKQKRNKTQLKGSFKNEDGDGIEETSDISLRDNSVDSDPVSPVLGSSRRFRTSSGHS